MGAVRKINIHLMTVFILHQWCNIGQSFFLGGEAILRDSPCSMSPCPPNNLGRDTQEMLNTYASQHPKFQGPSEKFLKVLSRKKTRGTGKDKEKRKLVRGKEWAVVLDMFVLPLPWSSKLGCPQVKLGCDLPSKVRADGG